MESLIWCMNQHCNASGFILDGVPRCAEEYKELKTLVSFPVTITGSIVMMIETDE